MMDTFTGCVILYQLQVLYKNIIIKCRNRLTRIPACENATGMANIPVPRFPLITCITVPKFL